MFFGDRRARSPDEDVTLAFTTEASAESNVEENCRKIEAELIPGVNIIKLFTDVIYKCS
jgi:hypothetical protein